MMINARLCSDKFFQLVFQTKYTNMTFIWTEISFLSLWWKSAHPTRKANLRKLLSEGRLEILTGGWVMTDEANVHLFAMVDQLIEGHQWLLNNLNVKPRSSWSVDPFGHGSAFPYVLKASGVDSMVIMRIHYAWKEWFAKEQSGDFMWRQNWDPTGKDAILCHNFPFDIYSVKGSCGPQSQTCLQFNFAQVPGRYSEYSGRTIPVTASNIRERSELILDQWGKTGSLFPHNVVLVPLGDDFTYSNEAEWDQQYSNYNQIMEYINSNGYEASVQWGTLTDYFNAVHARTAKFDTLTGDFFVYSDVFSDGVPAYWSGYYSTRPFMKKMSRELEASLRTAEILFTWSFNLAARLDNQAAVKHLEANYVGLTTARANLALFQHHDAITGTAKQFVVHDYGEKLFNGIIATRNLLKNAAQFLLLKVISVLVHVVLL
jgi:alpha-mannosidase